MMRRILVSLTCLTLGAGVVVNGSAERDPREHPRVKQALALLEVWLDAQRDYEQIPGISAGVVHDQDLIWGAGFGFADLERQAPATPGTIYSICSISKLFTSIGVMQLRDAGRLRLDDPVTRHLPWFDIGPIEPDGGPVTVEGLITHSSGLPRESDFPYWTGPDYPFPTREQIVERLSGQDMLYPAETYFQYSNLGLTLAGEIVAAASEQPYEQYVRERILGPLGLESTTPEMPEAQRGDRLATGYSGITREGSRVAVPFFLARGIAPAAGYASTVEDLGRFASWQFRVLAGKAGDEVLARNTLREMHRVHWVDPDFETTWGLGFSVSRRNGTTFVGHGGSCPGFRTQLLLQADERVAAIFMANAQGVNTGQFTQRMYEIVGPAISAARKAKEAPEPVDPALSTYVGNYATGFSGEVAVVVWEDGLAMVGLPTMDPMGGLEKLRKVGEHTFRRVRDDETLGESVVFEMGPDGRPTALIRHSNRYRLVR